jgi:hypothetical protein
VVVALAAKLARIAWAVLRHGGNYDQITSVNVVEIRVWLW